MQCYGVCGFRQVACDPLRIYAASLDLQCIICFLDNAASAQANDTHCGCGAPLFGRTRGNAAFAYSIHPNFVEGGNFALADIVLHCRLRVGLTIISNILAVRGTSDPDSPAEVFCRLRKILRCPRHPIVSSVPPFCQRVFVRLRWGTPGDSGKPEAA